MKLKAGILGSTGYTGVELLRLIVNHGSVDLRWITSEKFAGRKISSVFPNLLGFTDLVCKPGRDLDELEEVDIVFSCLPHTISMHFIKKFLDKGTRIIDFSADSRFHKMITYNTIFRIKHRHPQLCDISVYGLPEIFRQQIPKAQLVANPGCFATSILLGIMPMVDAKMISGTIFVDSKTGFSGSGRAPSSNSLFSEVNEAVSLNSISDHPQKYEVEEKLLEKFSKRIKIIFGTYYLNANRGILTTITSRLKYKTSRTEILNAYKLFYDGEPFVRIYDNEKLISTKYVRFTNYCDIGINIQDHHIICITALDNLGKGASGQAVQNMNIMFGIDEMNGLTYTSIYP